MPKKPTQPTEPEEVLEGDVEEISEEEERRRNERAYRETQTFPANVQSSLAVRPQVKPTDLVARLDAIKETAASAMEENVDFGKIPGTDKPTLLKPGAEKLAVLFKLDPEPENEERWEEGGHLTVVSRTTLYDKETGVRCGSGEGICSTREEKYAFRNAKRKCPSCGEEAIIKGKEEYGGGWVCFKKLGGCNAKFPDGSEEIENQKVGKVPNEALPDVWNTISKMASKRSLVAAVLIVTGASAIFTQDQEQEVETQSAASTFPPATKEQNKALSDALMVLMPESAARVVYEQIRGCFGEQLPGPAADAVCAVVRAHKEVKDADSDERAGQKQAEREASGG